MTPQSAALNIALLSALLITIFAAAVTSYLTAHLGAARIIVRQAIGYRSHSRVKAEWKLAG